MFHSCTIFNFEAYQMIPYDFLKLNFSYFYFTTQVTLFFVEKTNLKSVWERRIKKKTTNFRKTLNCT